MAPSPLTCSSPRAARPLPVRPLHSSALNSTRLHCTALHCTAARVLLVLALIGLTYTAVVPFTYGPKLLSGNALVVLGSALVILLFSGVVRGAGGGREPGEGFFYSRDQGAVEAVGRW